MTGAAADAWDRAAEGWNRSTPLVHAWLRSATEALIAEARIHAGARVLDLAAGTGDQTKDIARAVGPEGEVLATDISPKILDLARKNIQAAGLTNITFALADAEQPLAAMLPFDAVLCRLGLMFCLNPAAALSSAFKALRPGGRFVALVFGEPASNPCISIMMKVARRRRGFDGSASPCAPGSLFSLSDPGQFAGLLAAAGYADISVRKVAAPFELADAGTYVSFVRDSGSPIMEVLAPLDADAKRAAWQEIEDELDRFQSAEGWSGPNELLLCSASRP
ncbi:MAG: methyltransferase domain-containing protein [Variovorax sp.]